MATQTTTIEAKGGLRQQVSEAEWETRVNLAAAFRIAHALGWNDGVTNHITARLPDAPDQFVICPQGLGWDEMTASCLVKADLSGRILSNSELSPGPAGLNFHSAILAARPDVACTMHIHPMAGVVISALKGGLVILDQRGCLLHNEVAYHDFEGYARAKDEAPRIVAELGTKRTMIMRNHGVLAVGRAIGEVFYFMGKLIAACELQERVMATGGEIQAVPEDIIAVANRQSAERYRDRPYGNLDWKMLTRRLARVDSSFMA
jgi:ribulose-5-phosphate 4-epimerase/fuculose-1-phosphate aldolase